MSEQLEALVRQLYGLQPVTRSLARHAFAELGSQGFGALVVVHQAGPVRPSEVAERMAIDLSVASRQLAALVKAGYVRREADPDDGRAHRVVLTPAGERVLRDSHRRMVADVSEALAAWDADDIQSLTVGLAALRETLAPGTGPREPIQRSTS